MTARASIEAMACFPRIGALPKTLLRKLGLLPLARWLRRDLPHAMRFGQFRSRYGKILRPRESGAPLSKTAILVTGPHTCLPVDLWLLKGLELAGFRTVVLGLGDKHWEPYFRLAGASEVLSWDQFSCPQRIVDQARSVVDGCRTLQELIRFEHAGARVGRIAASTAIRDLRIGALEIETSASQREHLAGRLAFSMSLAEASRQLLERFAPDLAVFYDMVYTRRGEIFDLCLRNRIPAVVWHPAHRNNSLMLKLYCYDNRREHPASLSPESWRRVQDMAWTDAHRASLGRELSRAYSAGDWYGESGTQFSKTSRSRAEIQRLLGLDPGKKCAFVFAHIAWDAPLSWGESLFDSYEQWLVETVRAACGNDKVNWVVKIHPANVGKQLKEGYYGEPAELMALRRHVPVLPPHVFLLPAESEISTYSLFALMDYCLTVRGTIGIEAASFGIPVLTAGSGRYDRRGFTVDSESRADYLSSIGRIQEIPSLSAKERELAERFAYGIFMMRPFVLESVSLEYDRKCSARANFTRSRINAATAEEWQGARDLGRLARWLAESSSADYLAAGSGVEN